jgi:hypothetical protein
MTDDNEQKPRIGGGLGLIGRGGVFPGQSSGDRPEPCSVIDDKRRHREALAAALRKRGRGRPSTEWRRELRGPMLAVMRDRPNIKQSEWARTLFEEDCGVGAALREFRVSLAAIQNWLSSIKPGSRIAKRK